MIHSSACPPWPPDHPARPAGEPDKRPSSYTTLRGTILSAWKLGLVRGEVAKSRGQSLARPDTWMNPSRPVSSDFPLAPGGAHTWSPFSGKMTGRKPRQRMELPGRMAFVARPRLAVRFDGDQAAGAASTDAYTLISWNCSMAREPHRMPRRSA